MLFLVSILACDKILVIFTANSERLCPFLILGQLSEDVPPSSLAKLSNANHTIATVALLTQRHETNVGQRSNTNANRGKKRG